MDTPVRHLLEEKGAAVWSVTSDTSVLDALRLMAEKEIGALMVIDGGQLVGIVTERDYARKIILLNRSSHETPVRTIMTERVLGVSPDRTVRECMAIMTERRLRHLPVIDDGTVLGVLSMRDIVAHVVGAQEFLIEQLTQYITSA